MFLLFGSDIGLFGAVIIGVFFLGFIMIFLLIYRPEASLHVPTNANAAKAAKDKRLFTAKRRLGQLERKHERLFKEIQERLTGLTIGTEIMKTHTQQFRELLAVGVHLLSTLTEVASNKAKHLDMCMKQGDELTRLAIKIHDSAALSEAELTDVNNALQFAQDRQHEYDFPRIKSERWMRWLILTHEAESRLSARWSEASADTVSEEDLHRVFSRYRSDLKKHSEDLQLAKDLHHGKRELVDDTGSYFWTE